MKTIRNACKLQPKALDINVSDQIEQLDQVINESNGNEYFEKTFITDGMKSLLSRGMARLAGKSNDSIFHLKQAMGGGKTHLIVGFGLLAKNPELRLKKIGNIPYQSEFGIARVAAFNGRNRPPEYFWGEIAKQLDKSDQFKDYWESGLKAPDEKAWLELFEGDNPTLILLDEMPPYFHYYNTQQLGNGTIADVVTNAFSNMLTAAQKKKNICIVVSDLEAAYDTGGKLIQRALDDAKQELGRAEVSITPVNLESNEIYEILRKRLFLSLPNKAEITEIASVYASKLSEAAKAKTVERSAEALANDIESTYPFHPSFRGIVALFKENEKFKQTRGLMELVSRLLKSVWNSDEDIYLIGAQHFDLSVDDVREKLAEISEMRDVIARDIWDSTNSAHAQSIDLNSNNNHAKQIATLLLTASLSTAVNSIKGLTQSEVFECLIDPHHKGSDFKNAFDEFIKSAWYLHQSQEGRTYFSHQENLTKKLQGYADKAPQNKVDQLIRHRLEEMYKPVTKEAYEVVLPLPEMDEAGAELKSKRALLIISPDGKVPPSIVTNFYNNLTTKNNILVLTGEKSSMASVETAARHVYASTKADGEISDSHPQRKELDEKKTQYQQDFQSTVISVFDKILFPGYNQNNNEDILRNKPLDSSYPSNEAYNGERQIMKTLTSDPIKLYTSIEENFDTLRARVEATIFGKQEELRKLDIIDKMKQNTQMPWLPPRAIDELIRLAQQKGLWEDLGNGYITIKPKPKSTGLIINTDNEVPDDEGKIRLKLETINAGPNPRIYYEEDAEVSEQKSQTLKENILVTNALRVQFLVIDPTKTNLTGDVRTWTNKLVIRNKLDETSRRVELFVVPRGNIKYTLDGSEPRNGLAYKEPIQLEDKQTKILVFAECEGLEARREFTFKASGSKEITIKKEKPATLKCTSSPKKLDSTTKTYEALKIAQEKSIEFEQVTLNIGSSPRNIYLSLGEMRIKAEFLEEELQHLQSLLLEPNAPIVMSFKKAYTQTGFDLEEFTKKLGIEINHDEVEQNE
jgi:hypothetical protein